jgi:hypothetical protein
VGPEGKCERDHHDEPDENRPVDIQQTGMEIHEPLALELVVAYPRGPRLVAMSHG